MMKDKDDFFGLSRSQERERERDFQIGLEFLMRTKSAFKKKTKIFLRRTYCYIYIVFV